MVADALTKPMISIILYELLTTGYWRLDCGDYSLRMAELTGVHDESYEEKDLIQIANRPEWAKSPSCGLLSMD